MAQPHYPLNLSFQVGQKAKKRSGQKTSELLFATSVNKEDIFWPDVISFCYLDHFFCLNLADRSCTFNWVLNIQLFGAWMSLAWFPFFWFSHLFILDCLMDGILAVISWSVVWWIMLSDISRSGRILQVNQCLFCERSRQRLKGEWLDGFCTGIFICEKDDRAPLYSPVTCPPTPLSHLHPSTIFHQI